MPIPSDQVLEEELKEALRSQNIEELSLKNLRAQLESKFEVDLSEKKKFLKEAVTRLLSEEDEGGSDENAEEQDNDGEDEEDEEAEADEPPENSKSTSSNKRKTTTTGSAAAAAASKKKGGRGGRTVGKYQLSTELDSLLGCGQTLMNRGDVTRGLWKYIKANELQDPKNKSKIRNDERMFKVFKCKTMTMFQMTKKLSSHVKKYSDLVVGDEELEEESNDDDEDDDPEPPRAKVTKKVKVAAGQRAKTAPTSAGKKRPAVAGRGSGKGTGGVDASVKKEKKPRRPSTIRWKVSPQLAEVVGAEEATFDAIRAGVNKYIKDHNLQDPLNKRMINCDAKLLRIMGKRSVNMFGMQKLYAAHRLEKIE